MTNENKYYKMWQHWQGIIPSLLSGLPRLPQVTRLSVGVCTLCLLHLGRQRRASLHGVASTKLAQARWQAWRRGTTEEQCARREEEGEREEEKLCIKFSCCSFSSGWPRSGGTEECVPDKLSITRPGRGTPRSDGDRPTPESACNPRGPLRRRGTGKQSFSAALSMQSSVGVSE